MAEKKKAAAAQAAAIQDADEELVSCTLPADPGRERQELVVAVNGETIRIRRGEQVRLRRKFLKVLEAAARQDAQALRCMERLTRQ